MADKSKDTGTGGINVDGKVYTPDVGVADDKGGDQGNYSSGDISVDKTTKDISTPTRETFAKYLSKTTLGIVGSSTRKNVYPVAAGDKTTLEETTLKDSQGNPVSPGPQNNEAKFNADFNQQISSNNPAGIRRGAATGTGPDGNELLANIAPIDTTTKLPKLTVAAETYITAILKPNLNDIYNSKTETGVVIPEYENDGAPTGIKDLNKTHTFATDAGTSKNILGDHGTRRLKLLETATQASKVTVNNFFKVDLPNTEKDGQTDILVTRKLTGITPDSVTDAQNHPFASSFFTKGIQIINNDSIVVSKLESSYSNTFFDASKTNNQNPLAQFSIKRGKVAGVGETGNELLPLATIPAILSDRHIKFTALNINVSNYTTVLLKKNLYSINNKIEIGNLQNSDFFGLPRLHKPESGLNDAGTFDNIQKDPSKRAITQASLFQHVVDEVAGKNAPGNIGNVYKLNSFPSKDLFSFTTPEGVPASPTAAQNNIVSIDQYTMPAGDHLAAADVKLQSSYSNATENLKIRRGKSIQDSEIPDGNTLLKDAAAAADAGPYVKKSGDVSPTISKYVDAILSKNRYHSEGVNQFVPTDTVGATSEDFNEIHDLVSASDRTKSFIHRTKLYAPHELKSGESPQSTKNRGEDIKGYNFISLTRIGTLLQFKAAGEFAYLAGYKDSRGTAAELFTMIPGLGQSVAGAPLSIELIKVTEIIKNLPNIDDADTNTGLFNEAGQYEGELIDFNRHFEGIINTTSEKFSSYSSIAIFVLAALLVTVVVFAILGLAKLIAKNPPDALYPDGKPKLDPATNIGYFGSFRGRAESGGTNIIEDIAAIATGGFKGTALFGIKSTTNINYSDAVNIGALAFFGLEGKPPQILAFPGQAIVIARAIIRSVSEIIKQLAAIGLSMVSGNILDGIFKLIGIIQTIRNSKLIGALNIFSQLGDRRPIKYLDSKYSGRDALAAELDKLASELGAGGAAPPTAGAIAAMMAAKDDLEKTRADDIGKVISEIDKASDARTTREQFWSSVDSNLIEYYGVSHIKSRRKDTKELAWATYRIPSLYLGTGRDGNNELNALQGNFHEYTPGLVDNQAITTRAVNNDRLDDLYRIKIEAMLGSEYLPFYFHDLRTNEILGFHAFLTSLSDDYSANYETSTGIGRIEPIKSYKDTQRKIGLSFLLAATSEHDFDHMWDKINKLTTLVYPQYTRGKIYDNQETGYRFEKPFTQQVAAGPMIRLRVGNLFTSNYSRFNLAGVFGLTESDRLLGIKDKDERASREQKLKDEALGRATATQTQKYNDSFAAWLTDPAHKYNVGYVFNVKSSSDLHFNFVSKEDFGGKNKPAAQLANNILQSTNAATAVLKKGGKPRFAGPKADQPGQWYSPQSGDTFTITEVGEGGKVCKGNFKYKEGTAEAEVKGFYVYSDRLLGPTKETLEKQKEAAKLNDVALGALVDEPAKPLADSVTISEFMEPKNNAIVKAFESAGGEGLAGFIDSMSFDWYENVTWDIDPHRLAPKMCKITISFSPTHDITPGLDHRGRNRAPIYRVGAGRVIDDVKKDYENRIKSYNNQ